MFIAVVEEASIAKAADREHLAPSAVSKRVADWETVVRVPLLKRHRRGVRLTTAGEALLSHFRRLLRDVSRLEAEMSEFSSTTKGTRGHIRASANESALLGFSPDSLGRFTRDYPHITVEVQPDTSTGVVRAVREGAANLGIFGSEQAVDDLNVMSCYVDRFVVVAPKSHTFHTGWNILRDGARFRTAQPEFPKLGRVRPFQTSYLKFV